MSFFSRISQVAAHVPDARQTGDEIEERLRDRNPHLSVPSGLLRQLYGFEARPLAPAGTLPSDLATAAGRRALADAGLTADSVDLLLYAGISEDVEEPATAHIVADRLGVHAPVFDVKNACNGMLNGLQVADALVRDGQCRRALVVTGELGSRVAGWDVPDRRELALRLPAFTTGDLGAALLVEAAATPGILGTYFTANSAGWRAATLGNPHFGPDDPAHARIRIDSDALLASFAGMETSARDALHALGHKVDDLAVVCVHQASVPFTQAFCDALGVRPDQIALTFPRHGNATTASLPLQLAEALADGRLRRGDLVGLFGLASGASGGVVLVRW
ncbi:3-oxoacyl-ACP synthase III family protein [Streptomyces sp. TRM64462]|uniref:3-oxoacyl-ACP synthase III family protein n=1 Tax=Streptomyces sp. TRM64462 TaxID=2741726 RepID=UPI001586A985|nr:ketoacyl-ACP synthase III [Streptomyces sp. TRM64462]